MNFWLFNKHKTRNKKAFIFFKKGPLIPLLLVIFTCKTLYSQENAEKSNLGDFPLTINSQDRISDALLKKYHSTIRFEENKGQWDRAIDYQIRNENGLVKFHKKGISFGKIEERSTSETISFINPNKPPNEHQLKAISEGLGDTIRGHVWNLNFHNVNHKSNWEPQNPWSGIANYFKGDQTLRGLKNYKELWLTEIYEQTDLRYYTGKNGVLEFDFILHPGANIEKIELEFEGIDQLHINQYGDLTYQISLGEMQMSRPYAYQIKAGKEKEVKCRYHLENDKISFELIEEYDPNLPLIIDPVILDWSTYLGNSLAAQIVLDSTFAYYVAYTTVLDYPTTTGAFQTTSAGSNEIVITQLNKTTGQPGYSTYFGGTGADVSFLTRIDNDHLYISGYTTSSDFPMYNAIQDTLAGSINGFLLKMDAQAGTPSFSTYIGGNLWDLPFYIDVHNETVYMAGWTRSTNLPVSPTAYQTTHGGSFYDVLVGVINTTTPTFDYISYVGGNAFDLPYSIDYNDGYAFIAGYSASTDFPTTTGAFQTNHTNGNDGFVIRYNESSNSIDYVSFIGDQGLEQSRKAIALPGGEVVIGTSIDNEIPSFPVTPGLFQDTPPQPYVWTDDLTYINGLYLLKLDALGQMDWATYVGGSAMHWPQGHMDYDGSYIYILGGTNDTNWPFPPNALSTTIAGDFDLVFTKIDPNTGMSAYTTLLGGSGYEEVQNGYFVAKNDYAYFSYLTDSDDLTISSDAIQSVRLSSGNTNAVGVINHNTGALRYNSYFEGSSDAVYAQVIAPDEDDCFYMANITRSVDYPISNGAYIPLKTQNGAYWGVISKVCDFCPSYTNNSINPNDQIACSGGVLDQIFGSDVENDIPSFLRDGVTESYTFSEKYVWQISADSATWIDIPGASTKDYLPVAVTATTYLRRLKVNNSTNCIDTVFSNVHTININGFTAPEIDPGEGFIICDGGSIQIGNDATGGTAPYIYSWTPTASLDDPSISQPNASPSVSTNYTIDVTDVNNCLQRAQVLVTVLSNSAGPDVSSCNGQGVQIGTPAIPNQPSITYSWSPTTDLSDPNIAQPIANPTVDTDYILTINGPMGCPQEDTVSITILNVVADAGPDQTVCQGTDPLIGTTAQAGITYGWAPGLYIDNQVIAQPTFHSGIIPNPNPYTYTLTAIDLPTGCSDVDTLIMTVNKADAGKNGCGPRFIGPASDHSNGLATYTWNVVSGDVASLTTPNAINPFVAPSTSTTYALEVEWNSVICRDTVIVPPCGCPVPDITAISEIDCAHGGYALDLFVTLGQDTASYDIVWSPTTGLSNPTGYLTTVAPTATDIVYTATVSHKDDPSIICSETITVYGSATAIPEAYVRDTATCPGQAVQIGVAPVAGWTYEWSPEEGLSNPNISNPIATPTQSTQYNLTVTDAVTECAVDTFLTVIVQSPVIDAGPDQEFCAGAVVTLGTAVVPNQTYQWTPAGSLFPDTIAQPTDTLYISTTYTLMVTDTLTGCSETDDVIFTQTSPPIAEAGPPSVDLCPGGNGIMIGTMENPNYTYNWSPTTGLDDPTSSSPIANPGTTTPYNLFVTNGATGCFAQDQITVNITAGVIPTVDAGADEQVCVSGSIALNATASEAGTFSWSPVDGLSDPNIANPTANPSSTTTYTVTFTNGGGCVNTDQVTIEVIDDPVANAGSDLMICEGESVQIGSTAQTNATYAWSPITGLDDPTIAQPTATPTANTTYTVAVSMPGGCVSMDDVNISIKSLPTADAGSDQVVCASAVQIGTADASGGANSYLWSPNTGLNNATSDQPDAQPGATTEYILTVTNPDGCEAKDTVIVTPGAVADAGSNQLICEGQSVQIGTIDAMDGSTYSWSPSDGLDNANIAQPNASPSTSTTYTLTVMNGACTSSDEVTVNVLPSPSVSAGSNLFICGGASVQLGSSTIPSTSYIWSPSTDLDDPTIAQPTATPGSTTIYTITATNDFTGCQAAESVTINVTGMAPTADAGADQTLCYGGGSASIGSAGIVGYTYSWSPTIGLSDAFAPEPTATVISTTTYTVTVTDNTTGCTNSDAVTLTVSDALTLPAAKNDTICQGGSIQIGDTAIAGYSYQWSPSEGLDNDTLSNPTASPSSTTVYNLLITDTNGCINTTSDTVFVLTSPAPSVDAGSDQIICEESPLQLGTADTNGGMVTYNWTPNSALDDSSLDQPTFTPPAGFSGIVNFTVEVSDGTCTQTDHVNITVLPQETAEAGIPFTNCGGEITLNASAISNGMGTWTHESGTGTPIINAPNDTLTTISNLDLGLHTFRWTITGTDICNPGTFDEITIQIAEIPVLAINDPLEACPADLTESSITTGTTGSGTLTYWKDASATMSLPGPHNWSKAGTYYIKITSPEGCMDIDPIDVLCSCPANNCSVISVSVQKGSD